MNLRKCALLLVVGVVVLDPDAQELLGELACVYRVHLGEALAEKSEKHFVATKIGHFKEAAFFRSPQAMLVQFREGLRQLRRQRLDELVASGQPLPGPANMACKSMPTYSR